jgi:hypothetical protein
MFADRQAGMDRLIHGPGHAGQLACHFIKAGEFCFQQMAKVSHSGDSGIIAQAVGKYKNDFAQIFISLLITENSGL